MTPPTPRVGAIILTLLGSCLFATDALANPALEGYSNANALRRRVAKLAKSNLVSVETLAKTAEGRRVDVLTIGRGKADAKPAVLIVGNVEAAHVAGSEFALRMAEQIVRDASKNEAVKKLLDEVTLYVIPRPNPDGTEKHFRKPWRAHVGNARKTDDDRDFEIGEDPPEDLNGDGWITMMRVEDSTGEYILHPQDPRVMIKANAKKDEQGRYRLLSEGRDNDEDEQFNEDAADGVSLNRNFTFKYPAFKKAAGENAASEVETRAIADFAFDHPDIVAVLTFTPEDNLMKPWQPNAAAEKERVKTTLLADDAPYQNFVAERYRKTHGGKSAPSSPKGAGSFSDWAYFHYGRWSLAARGWWIPPVETKKPAEKSDNEEKKEEAGDKKQEPEKAAAEKKTDEKKPDAKKPAATDKRGADDIAALKWFEANKIDGFVEWKELEHPDFPDSKVEVGGFKPLYRLNPPADQLDTLAETHVIFLAQFTELLPQLAIAEAKVEPLVGGVFRVTTTVVNQGYLPTMSKMGDTSRAAYPVQVELKLPKGAKVIQGSARRNVPRLAGRGGKHETTWLVRTSGEKPAEATVRVWAPAVGEATARLKLKP